MEVTLQWIYWPRSSAIEYECEKTLDIRMMDGSRREAPFGGRRARLVGGFSFRIWFLGLAR